MANTPSNKRGRDETDDDPSEGTSSSGRQPCKHGRKCYRQNPTHFKEWSHPHLEKLLQRTGSLPKGYNAGVLYQQLETIYKLQCSSTRRPGEESRYVDPPSSSERALPITPPMRLPTVSPTPRDVAGKLEVAAPFNLFLTTVASSAATQSELNSLTFADLLDKSLGDFHSSLHINYMVEMDWMMSQYKIHGLHRKPLHLLYGIEDERLKTTKMPPSIVAIKVKPSSPFGHHHSKVCMIHYTNGGLRIIVSTANLIESDWENRTQGLWVSPICPKLPEGMASTKPGLTEFKTDLLKYLENYKLPELTDWIQRLKQADCSKINVHFVASVPGSHDQSSWGHPRLANLLQKNTKVGTFTWPLVAQCSSIGSLGPKLESWMGSEWGASMTRGVLPQKCIQTGPGCGSLPLKMVYPSRNDVVKSYDGIAGGACLPYSSATHTKQEWFTTFMHRWKADARHRTRAMPHIKTYARMSTDNEHMSWFMLTSANLSKAAWGAYNADKATLRILSYEAGVLFTPNKVIGAHLFPMKGPDKFPMPYDLPLIPYDVQDKPWVAEYMK